MPQTLHLPYVQPKGEVTLKFRDAKTLELKRTIEHSNVMTALGYNRAFGQRTHWWDTGSFDQRFSKIYVSDRKMSPIEAIQRIGTTTFAPSTTFGGNTKLTTPSIIDGNPPFSEVEWRFNAPATTRTINLIYVGREEIGPTVNTEEPLAYVALQTPCIQSTTEVLDITYRVQLFPQDIELGDSVGISPDFGYFFPRFFFSNDDRGDPWDVDRLWNSNIPENGKYRSTQRSDLNFATTREAVSDQGAVYKRRFEITNTTAGNVGAIFGALAYGGADSDWSRNGHRNSAWAPATPADFPNKPIQPIHNHNADAINPFLDVDFLATSQGSLTVNGDGWTNPDWPKFYRVEYFKTGDVGVANYAFRKRDTLGFRPGTDLTFNHPYAPFGGGQKVGWGAWSSNLSGQADANGVTGFCSVVGIDETNSEVVAGAGFQSGPQYHGIRPRSDGDGPHVHEYDPTTIITWDKLGVVIQDIVDPDRLAFFNAGTSPSLPVTNVTQVARDAAGNVYVACRDTGLYVIGSVFAVGSPGPTITKITNAVHGIPAPEKCFGVAEGFGDRIWAVFDGALSYTEDSGATWTNLDSGSSPVFSHPKIDGDFDSVLYLLADREASTHEVALIHDPDGTTTTNKRVIWYTPSVGSPLGTATEYSRDFTWMYKAVNVSYRGSIWVGMNNTSTVSQWRIKFGDSATTNEVLLRLSSGRRLTHNGGGTYPFSGNVTLFYYDYYGIPITTASGSVAGGVANVGITAFFWPDGEFICESGQNQSGATGRVFEQYSVREQLVFEQQPTGVYLMDAWSAEGAQSADVPFQIIAGPTSRLDGGNALPLGSGFALNHQFSPFEDMVWAKYHWNGAAWEKNYFADAIDSSGNGFDAERENFNTEDYTFTGRSLIDTSVAFPTGTYSNDATVALTITPTEKFDSTITTLAAKSQEYETTLFAVSDPTTGHHIRVVWRDKSNNIVIEHDTAGTLNTDIVGATPANDVEYRVVVTVSGTTVTVYIDGSAFGSTATLDSSFDFSNPSSGLKSFLGSRTYIWDYQQHSTLPGFFYRGTMENVQYWNRAWSAGDVTTDFAGSPAGTIPVGSPQDLIAQYLLTQSLVGLETKTTHFAAEDLDDGITIAFSDGTAGNSFVSTDYHTFGVVDGILKDNATSFTQEYTIYVRPADIGFTEFTNPAGGNTVPGSPTQVTEIACWAEGKNPTDTFSGVVSQPGQVSGTSTAGSTDSFGADRGRSTAQNITGDGYFEGAAGTDDDNSIIGFMVNPTAAKNRANVTHGIRFQPGGTVDIIEGAADVSVGVASYVRGDVFRVERTGTTVRFYKVDGSPPTLLFTSGTPSSGTIYGAALPAGRSRSIWKARINWTQPAYTMRVGKASTGTGAYDDFFYLVDTDVPESIKIRFSGSPEVELDTLTEASLSPAEGPDDTWWDNLPAPGPGQVTVSRRTGHLIFNSADVGETVTGELTVVFTRT